MNYHRITISISSILSLFILSFAAMAQEKNKAKEKEAQPPKTRIEYSLDTVARRLDNMHMILNRVNEFTSAGFQTNQVEKQLPEIRILLQTIDERLEPGHIAPESKSLQLFDILLQDIRQKLEDWRNSLFKFNNDLISMNTEIDAFTHDSIIHQVVKDTLYRKMYIDELSELRTKWQQAGKATAAHLTAITNLQADVSRLYFQTIDLQSRIRALKQSLEGALFNREFPDIWAPGAISSNADTTKMRSAASSYKAQRSVLNYYIRGNWSSYLYVLLIGLLFYFWVWRNLRRIARAPSPGSTPAPSATAPPAPSISGTAAPHPGLAPPAASEPAAPASSPGAVLDSLRYLRGAPVLSTLTLMLNIIPFFDIDAPAAYTQIIQFFLLIVLSLLFFTRWERRYFLYWVLIVLFYMLFSVTGVVLIPAIGARLWLILLNIVAIYPGYMVARRVGRYMPHTWMVRIAAVVYLFLNILAILANVFGRLSLARLLSTSAIFGLVQVIGLAVFISIALESLTIQDETRKISDHDNKQGFFFGKVRKALTRLLIAFAALTWIIVLLINLDCYDQIYAGFRMLMQWTIHLGSISFRLGNLILFILIIYISNLLQKYVGFFFGASDGHTLPDSSRKGSRLVMVKLILIIAGFLLAISASGLPLDKITIVLGALGVGIGLGLQNIVNNLVSGIILIFERPFQIGDYIELNGKRGIVRDIGIRSSKIVTEEGTEVIIPNGDLLSGEVINWTVRDNKVRIEVPLTIEAGHSYEQINGIVQDTLARNEDLSKEHKPRLLMSTAGEKAITYTVIAWVGNISQIQTIKSEILTQLYQAFRDQGIKTL